MANRAGDAAAATEVIPAGHAALPEAEEGGGDQSDISSGLAGLSLAALGVVFGDIGTSPVYTFRECFNPERGLPLDPEHVLGGSIVDILGVDHRSRRQIRSVDHACRQPG